MEPYCGPTPAALQNLVVIALGRAPPSLDPREIVLAVFILDNASYQYLAGRVGSWRKEGQTDGTGSNFSQPNSWFAV